MTCYLVGKSNFYDGIGNEEISSIHHCSSYACMYHVCVYFVDNEGWNTQKEERIKYVLTQICQHNMTKQMALTLYL